MEDQFIPKYILGGSSRGKRLVGRPHNRWEGSIQKDGLDLLHTQNCKSTAQKKTALQEEN
jgi:hypothetical protein